MKLLAPRQYMTSGHCNASKARVMLDAWRFNNPDGLHRGIDFCLKHPETGEEVWPYYFAAVEEVTDEYVEFMAHHGPDACDHMKYRKHMYRCLWVDFVECTWLGTEQPNITFKGEL